MKTILIVVFLSLANLSEPAGLAHKSYESKAACQIAADNLKTSTDKDPRIKTMMYCVEAQELLAN